MGRSTDGAKGKKQLTGYIRIRGIFLPCDITKPCQINSDAECRNQKRKTLAKKSGESHKMFCHEKKTKFAFFPLFFWGWNLVNALICRPLGKGDARPPRTESGGDKKRERGGGGKAHHFGISLRLLFCLFREWRRHMPRESPIILEQLVLQDYFVYIFHQTRFMQCSM